MKDPLHLKATADLDALQTQFSASRCITTKAKLFCVPGQGPPSGGGSCAVSTPGCKNVGGSCVCSATP